MSRIESWNLTQVDALLSPLRTEIDQYLDSITASRSGCPSRLTDAIRYSVLAPGKRIRPVLTLLACESVSGDWKAALPVACAVELVHVYSLIHDDLPCMDNDQLRRGRPTCHIQFDEATATLAGDCLQMLAIQTLCENLPSEQAMKCCHILAQAAGRTHLVGGQMDDLAAEGRFEEGAPCLANPSDHLDFLKRIHLRKTGALIEASLKMGGVIGGADSTRLKHLSDFGQAIGLAFQVVDDCLDVESTPEQLGKTPKKDLRQGKMTYPSLIGLAESRQLADDLLARAEKSLSALGDNATKLMQLAQFVVNRDH